VWRHTDRFLALAALFESSDDTVSRAQFEKFTKLVMKDQTAILGMSWIPRVTRAGGA
jgi:CHASE1-domain containing sensor protein